MTKITIDEVALSSAMKIDQPSTPNSDTKRWIDIPYALRSRFIDSLSVMPAKKLGEPNNYAVTVAHLVTNKNQIVKALAAPAREERRTLCNFRTHRMLTVISENSTFAGPAFRGQPTF